MRALVGKVAGAVIGALFALCGPGLTAAKAETGEGRRLALVIATENYETLRPLRAPVRDALAVDDLLDGLGFDVTLEIDRDLDELREAVADFAEEAKGAEIALVYYAGHGVEIGGENLLLPVDADGSGAEALRASALPLEEVVTGLREAVPAALVIVDACREDPFGTAPAAARDGTRSARTMETELPKGINGGFARVGRADGLLFAFSTAPGALASDGGGENSPFAAALLRHLPVEGQALPVALTLVQQDVYDRTRGWQLPHVETGLPALVFLAGTPPAPDEREQLLLQMAGISPAIRAEVEAVAARTGVPLAPLFAALLEGDPEATPDDQRALLDRAAAQYQEFRRDVERIRSEDAGIVALQEGALEDYALGALEAAEAKLEEAKRRGQEAVSRAQDRLAEEVAGLAQSYLLSARLAESRGRVEEAFADLNAADALFRQSGGATFPPLQREVWADVHLALAAIAMDRGWGEPDLETVRMILDGLSEEDPETWRLAAKRVLAEVYAIRLAHAAWAGPQEGVPDVVAVMSGTLDLARTVPDTAEDRHLLAEILSGLADALAMIDGMDPALPGRMLALAADEQARAAALAPSDPSMALTAVRRYLDVASLDEADLAAPATQEALDRLSPLLRRPAYPGAEELQAVALYLAALNLAQSAQEEQDYLARSLALLLRLQEEGRWPSSYLRTIDVTRALCEVTAAKVLDRPRAPCSP